MKPVTSIAALGVLLLGLGVSVRAETASNAYLEMPGMPGYGSHDVLGQVDVSDWIEISGFSDGVSRLTGETDTTRTRGRTQGTEVTFRKRVDPSTPLFYDAATRNQAIPTATFHFFGPQDDTGQTIEFYQVTLINVRVTSVTTTFEPGVGLVQEIKLVAQRFQWSYFGMGASTDAEWNTYEAF